MINLSLGGHELESPALTRAIAYASEHDALLVAAAGNDGDRGNAALVPRCAARRAARRLEHAASRSARRAPTAAPPRSRRTTRTSRVAAPGAGARRLPGRRLLDPAERGHAYLRGRSRQLRLALRHAGRPDRRPLRLRAGHELLGADRVRGRLARPAGEPGAARRPGRGRDPAERAPDRRHRLEPAHGRRRRRRARGRRRSRAPTTPSRRRISFGVVRAGLVGGRVGHGRRSRPGPERRSPGPGRSTVETSTDDKEFHDASRPPPARRCGRRCPLPPGARIWIRGTTCDGLHNCTTRARRARSAGRRPPPSVRLAALRLRRARLPPAGAPRRARQLVQRARAARGLERARLPPLPDRARALRRHDHREGARPDGGALPAARAARGRAALARERELAGRARDVVGASRARRRA